MNQYGLDFHHLGLAVRTPNTAKTFLGNLGYQIGEAVYDPAQMVNLSLCTATNFPDVEIIWPGEGEGPLDSMLSKRDGLVYHQCYATDCLNAAIKAMETTGHRVFALTQPTPAILFDGLRVSFYEVVGFGTIEIIDRASKAV